MSAKELIKKIPVIYPALLFVKCKIIYPIRSGHASYYLSYLFSVRTSEVKLLKQKGFKKICVFEPLTWRIGKGKDNAYRRYYTAYLDEKRCFIKVGKNDATVKNEAEIYNAIKANNLTFVANNVCIDNSFAADTIMIANEFICDLHSLSSITKLEDFAEICSSFIDILNKLKEIGLIHADIHKGNMMLTGKNKLLLLDFGISIFNSENAIIDYKARPGTFYVNSEDGCKRKYDDAYSFIKTIESLDIPNEWMQIPEYIEIVKRIGNHAVIINL